MELILKTRLVQEYWSTGWRKQGFVWNSKKTLREFEALA
jgi:hypothetical protein